MYFRIMGCAVIVLASCTSGITDKPNSAIMSSDGIRSKISQENPNQDIRKVTAYYNESSPDKSIQYEYFLKRRPDSDDLETVGLFTTYHRNGQIEEQGMVTCGCSGYTSQCKIGKWIKYSDNGEIVEIHFYKEPPGSYKCGKPRTAKESTVRSGWYYTKDVDITVQGNYENNKLIGRTLIRTAQGNYAFVRITADGKEEYYEQGRCSDLGINWDDILDPWPPYNYMDYKFHVSDTLKTKPQTPQ